MKQTLFCFECIFVFTLCSSPAKAANDVLLPNDAGRPSASLFHRGEWEVTLNGGVMFSPFIAVDNRPAVDYTLTAVQVGYMLNQPDPNSAGWWRGNYEFLGEAFGGAIVKGRGDYLAGGTLWLRYNLLPKDWKITPFAQLGMGAVATDIDRRLQGQNFNFNLELGLGFRYFIAQNLSLNLEYRYQHISNAGISRKNLGVNAQGPMVGVSWFF